MTQMQIMYFITLSLFGACMGSFLNVVIYRLPFGVSFVHPGSMCPGCGRELTVLENVPVLSWLVQRGKCRGCAAPIHWRYPGVEFLTAVLWGCVGLRLAEAPFPDMATRVATVLLGVWFMSYMVAISFIDYDHTIIPDELNYSGLLIAAVASFALPDLHPEAARWFPAVQSIRLKSLMAGGVGALAGGMLIFAISMIGTLAYRKKLAQLREDKDDEEIVHAIGMGDVKLMAFVGCFLGWREMILSFFIGTLLGAVIGMAVKLIKGESLIPYGPFLCAGAVIVYFFREPLLQLAMSRFGILFGGAAESTVGPDGPIGPTFMTILF